MPSLAKTTMKAIARVQEQGKKAQDAASQGGMQSDDPRKPGFEYSGAKPAARKLWQKLAVKEQEKQRKKS